MPTTNYKIYLNIFKVLTDYYVYFDLDYYRARLDVEHTQQLHLLVLDLCSLPFCRTEHQIVMISTQMTVKTSKASTPPITAYGTAL